MASPEKKPQIPAGQKQPLEGFPEIEREEPITEPASQPIPKAVEEAALPDPLVEVPAEPVAAKPAKSVFPSRKPGEVQGSRPDPEGQATVDRLPVREDTPEDRI